MNVTTDVDPSAHPRGLQAVVDAEGGSRDGPRCGGELFSSIPSLSFAKGLQSSFHQVMHSHAQRGWTGDQGNSVASMVREQSSCRPLLSRLRAASP